MRFLLLIYILLSCAWAYGQSDRNRIQGSDGGVSDIYIHDSSSSNSLKHLFGTHGYHYGISSIISASNGSLIFLDDGVTFNILSGKSLTPIPNSDSILPPMKSNLILRMNDSVYHVLHGWRQPRTSSEIFDIKRYIDYYSPFDTAVYFQDGIYVSEVVNSSKGLYLGKKNNKITNTRKKDRIIAATRISDYRYLLLLVSSRNPFICYIGSYQISGLVIHDSISFKKSDYVKETLPLDSTQYLTYFQISDARFSYNLDRLFISREAIISNDSISPIYKYAEIEIFKLDERFKSIGPSTTLRENHNIYPKVSHHPIIEEKYHYISTIQFAQNAVGQLVISPNDSFFYYYLKTYTYDSQDILIGIESKVLAYNFRLNSNSIEVATATPENYLNRDLRLNGIDLSPYGKLMVSFELPHRANYSWSSLPTTNNPTIKSDFTHSYLFLKGGEIPALHLYDYARFSYEVEYKCEAKIKIQNHTDRSNHLNQFMWIVQNENGKVDTSFGETPSFVFQTNGKYPFKVHAYSSVNNYSEWYIDTFHVDSIPSLFPQFQTLDSVFCRYAPVKFSNTSYSLNTGSFSTPKWLWDFGDGETDSTKFPYHSYLESGLFNVSLKYSIANCDTILSKARYIKVVDSPKPGFQIEKNIGCTPFTAYFSDTSTHNISKRSYYFSDNKLWKSYNDSVFTHKFVNPGSYFVVQRLYGFSGCITELDTIEIHVKPGIQQKDSMHLNLGTYSENNHVFLSWNPLHSAEYYNLYKGSKASDLKFYKSLHSLNFIDTIETPEPLYYQINAIDSCGNNSSFGREAVPMLLMAESNSKAGCAILNFNPYSNWLDKNIKYSIQTFTNGAWVEIGQNLNDTSFIDKEFLIENEFEKCYRVVARNDSLVSQSNSVCLPYEPIVFVPTAFSPNNDGNNDEFRIVTFGIVEYNIEIYDRWGSLVKTLNTNETWDGFNYKTGVYVIMISLKDRFGISHFRQDTLSLIR